MAEINDRTLLRANKLILRMAKHLHKGESGRIGVVGGSKLYTGAPYFSAMAAMLFGADLGHVFCTESASIPIKCHSPNLIVHPVMRESSSQNQEETPTNEIKQMFSRLSALVVGPGLGRDALMQKTALEVIKEARTHGLPIVLDADALFLIQTHSEVIKGYNKAILTPNVVEFKRLCESLKVPDYENSHTAHRDLAKKLGGVTIVRKGPEDYISNGTVDFKVAEEGGLKRCGGQGDILSGIMGTMCSWASTVSDPETVGLEKNEVWPLAAYAACFATRTASKLAFRDKARATQTTDLLAYVGEAYNLILEENMDIDSDSD